MDILAWRPPYGEVPEGWIERQCEHSNWLIKVWLSSSGVFECSYTNLKSGRRGRFNLKSSELREACDEAGEKCLSRFTEIERDT